MIGSVFMETESKKNGSQAFLQGALILTISMLIVKVIGAVFKIPLFRILTAEGYGYFTAAYDLYNPLFTIATAGFPIAIAKMVSENITRKRFRDVRQIHKVSIPIFAVMGIVGFLLMFGGTFLYVQMIKMPNAKLVTLTLSPTILFACLMAIYRGYYEGMRNMIPTAISEVIEAVCKLTIGISASSFVLAKGMDEYYKYSTVFGVHYETEAMARSAILPYAAACAISGITVGSFVGFIYLFIKYKKSGDGITKIDLKYSPKPMSVKKTVNRLVKIAIPVAIGALVMNIASLIDSILVNNRLYDVLNSHGKILLTEYQGLITPELIAADKAHTTLYGCYGTATTIMMLIPAITQTFGISALPTVTAAWTKGVYKEIKSSIESVMRVTMLVTIPAGLGLSVMAKPIMELLYLKANNQPEVDVAASVLTTLGIAAIFTSTSTPLCSMLQAVGRVDLPVKLLSIGVVIKILLNYTLVGIPEINIQGAGVGTLICYIFITVSAIYLLCKETHVVPNMVTVFIKPLLSSICSALSAYISYNLFDKIMPQKISTILALFVAVLVYVVALFLFRAITKKDIRMLPKGKKLVKVLEKYNLIR